SCLSPICPNVIVNCYTSNFLQRINHGKKKPLLFWRGFLLAEIGIYGHNDLQGYYRFSPLLVKP
ncbi:MAG: hypothetical protein ACLP2Y_07430, partial [Limisphaerales bacterium]